jgi:hypothetical protein
LFGKLGRIGPAGEYDCFKANLSMSVINGAVISSVICNVFLYLKVCVKGKIPCGQKGVFESYVFVLKLVFQGKIKAGNL